jgi:hypothetical protein
MSFPLSPTNGQLIIVNGINYIWDASKGAWRRVQSQYITNFQSAYDAANSAFDYANASFIQSNTINASVSAAYTQANTNATAITLIQGVNVYQNTAITDAGNIGTGAYAQANAANNLAQSAFNAANTGTTAAAAFIQANSANNLAQAAFNAANTGTTASAAFTQANAANNLATSAYNSANTNTSAITLIQGVNVSQNTTITAVSNYAVAGYGKANSADVLATAAYGEANAADTLATSGYAQANAANGLAGAAFAKANAATINYGPNNVIVANAGGFLSNTNNLQFLTSNNSLIVLNKIITDDVVTKNIIGPSVANTTITANGYVTTFDTTGRLTIPGPITFADGTSQNTAVSSVIVQASFDKANAANNLAQSAYNAANTGTTASAAFTQANAANDLATSGYAQANASNNLATSGYIQANAANNLAQASYNKANSISFTGYATETYVNNAVANLVNSAPTTLDTLKELSDALGADANFATTVATNIGNVNNKSNAAYNQANSANILAGAAFVSSNTNAAAITLIQGVNDGQNTRITAVDAYATSGYGQANAATQSAQSAYNHANNAYNYANTLVTLSSTQTLANKTLESPAITGTISGDGTFSGYLKSMNSQGDEGGEILLAKPATNSTIAGTGVTIDVWQNRLRFFEQGGSARGVYIDITAANTGVGTNLLLSSGGGTDITQATYSAQAAYNHANNAYNSSNTSVTLLQGVNEYQNTFITAVSSYAVSGYGQANAANNLAQAAYNAANSSSGSSAAFEQANAANVLASAAYAAANSGTGATFAYAQANAANNLAQAAFNAANTGGGSGGSSAILSVDNFTGNGTNTNFTLSATPPNENYTFVNIDGILQLKSSYSLSGNIITFSEAPSNGASIDVTSYTLAVSGFTTRNFVGDSTTVDYTVSSGLTANSIFVTENGVLQTPATDYTVNGTTLTFTSAPATGVNIQVREIAIQTDTASREMANAAHIQANAANSLAQSAYTKANTGTTLGKSIAMTIVFGG